MQGDLPVVEMSQLLRDGQPKAGGIVLGVGRGVKIAVEHGCLIFRRNAAPGVLHRHPGGSALPRAGHCDHTARRSIVDGVGNEILHHLL